MKRIHISFKLDEDSFYLVANKESAKYVASYSTCCHVDPKKAVAKELERNNLRNAFFNSNEIMEQRVESFKYSVKIESSYFAAGTKCPQRNNLCNLLVIGISIGDLDCENQDVQ